MEVLIISKTHIGSSACVGGVLLENRQYVRLMNGENQYQPGNTAFQIGEIWEIDFTENPDTPPHLEDVYVLNKERIGVEAKISSFIKDNLSIWEGTPEELFDGKLKWTGNNSGFINDKNNTPGKSVGFWMSDRDLVLVDDKFYTYPRRRFWRSRRLKYVGFAPKLATITAGTVIRVSLAKWWAPTNSEMEERCYLQLSGWYS